MKIFAIGICGIFLSATVSFAANCTERFSWLPNTEAGIAGYKIYYGLTDGGPFSDSVDISSPSAVDGRIVGEVPGLTCGEYYYFVATAYNSAGLESGYSQQVTSLVSVSDSGGTVDAQAPIIVNITLK